MNEFEGLTNRLLNRGSLWQGPVHCSEETGSTNDDARLGAKNAMPSGAIWISNHQTKGRGRQGRSWHSSRGENLLFSVLVRPKMAANEMPPVTLAVGVGVLAGLREVCGEAHLGIKWPNDLVLFDDMRKVAGILVESAVVDGVVDALVIGVGVNVNQLNFHEAIQSRATSLALLAGRSLDRCEVLASVLVHVEACVDRTFANGLSAIYEDLVRSDALVGRAVNHHRHQGIARGISSAGALLIETSSGMVEVGSGEVEC